MQSTEQNRAESIIDRISRYLRGICRPEGNAGFGITIARRAISRRLCPAIESGAACRMERLLFADNSYSPRTASAGSTEAARVAGYQLAARQRIKLPPTTKAISNGWMDTG